jgi:hypothetical protein
LLRAGRPGDDAYGDEMERRYREASERSAT